MRYSMTEARQKRIQSFAFVISIIAAVCLSWGFIENVAGPAQSHKIELDEKINPNNAPAASLVRLPGIGISRAEAIAAYREEFSQKNEIGPAFQNCSDLQKVKGIGPKTVQTISQWLKFE
jgi:competence ComEA-like helix-hairpin-helix protein